MSARNVREARTGATTESASNDPESVTAGMIVRIPQKGATSKIAVRHLEAFGYAH